MQYGEITIRMATDTDVDSIERLAQLDSKGTPTGPQLVAERGARMVAALSLQSGGIAADPFTQTKAAVELLRFRATQLRHQPGDGGTTRRVFERIARTVTA